MTAERQLQPPAVSEMENLLPPSGYDSEIGGGFPELPPLFAFPSETGEPHASGSGMVNNVSTLWQLLGGLAALDTPGNGSSEVTNSLQELIETWKENFHCNGSATFDQVLRSVTESNSESSFYFYTIRRAKKVTFKTAIVMNANEGLWCAEITAVGSDSSRGQKWRSPQ